LMLKQRRTCRSSDRSSWTMPPHPPLASTAQRAAPAQAPLRRLTEGGAAGESMGPRRGKRKRRRAAYAAIAWETTDRRELPVTGAALGSELSIWRLLLRAVELLVGVMGLETTELGPTESGAN
jgi:hypothetical protein